MHIFEKVSLINVRIRNQNEEEEEEKEKKLPLVPFSGSRHLLIVKFMCERERLFHIINTTYHSFLVVNHPSLVVVLWLPLWLTTTNNIYDFVCTHFNLHICTEQKILFSLRFFSSRCPVSSYLCSFLLSRLDFVITTSNSSDFSLHIATNILECIVGQTYTRWHKWQGRIDMIISI